MFGIAAYYESLVAIAVAEEYWRLPSSTIMETFSFLFKFKHVLIYTWIVDDQNSSTSSRALRGPWVYNDAMVWVL